jgi:hypothetical protein
MVVRLRQMVGERLHQLVVGERLHQLVDCNFLIHNDPIRPSGREVTHFKKREGEDLYKFI